jgi:hypothetical protein
MLCMEHVDNTHSVSRATIEKVPIMHIEIHHGKFEDLGHW